MKNKTLPRWSRLDNAAKIFPSNNSAHDSKVFRFSCELYDSAEPKVLQFALEKALQKFPFLKSVIKRGLFWYYLEESDLEPVVELENNPPCKMLYGVDCNNLLFRVFYYNKRISMEMHHVLADGTGALEFFCTLVYYYILERYKEDFKETLPVLAYDSSQFQKQDDSYVKYCKKPLGVNVLRRRGAYTLQKERLSHDCLSVLEGRISLKDILEYSRSLNMTITELLVAVFIRAIYQEMNLRDLDKPVVITVPVNLRNYFPSKTARNFFAVINAGYDFSRGEDSLEAIVKHIRECFKEELEEEKLKEQMNRFCSLERNILIRMLPLAIKDTVLRSVSFLTDRKRTASFSSLGRVSMPREMEKYINFFSVFTTPNILQACTCSFGDNYIVTFASPFKDRSIERIFFRSLVEMGIKVEVTANKIKDE